MCLCTCTGACKIFLNYPLTNLGKCHWPIYLIWELASQSLENDSIPAHKDPMLLLISGNKNDIVLQIEETHRNLYFLMNVPCGIIERVLNLWWKYEDFSSNSWILCPEHETYSKNQIPHPLKKDRDTNSVYFIGLLRQSNLVLYMIVLWKLQDAWEMG
jgi:hypothetical protein